MDARQVKGSGALPALTSIRFIAAVTVVLSHYGALGLLNTPAWFTHFVDGGRSAVSMFFVLSGFILTYTYRESLRQGGTRAFYVARVARIYPVVLFGLMLVAPVIGYLLYTDDTSLLLEWFSLKSNIHLALAISLACQLMLLNAWFPFAAINQPWNGPSDSVSCEAFFYAVFPWMLRKLDRRDPRRAVLLCLAVWVGQGVGIVMIQHLLPPSRSGFLVVGLPLLRVAEFVLGIGSALVFSAMQPRRSHALALVGIAIVCLCGLARWQPVSPAFYLQSPFFAMLILGLALLDRPVFGILNARWLVKSGEASYSLYLIHVPIAYLALLAGFDRSNGWMVFAFALAFSVVVFTFYEEPMRRAIRARLVSRPRPAGPVLDVN
jgi:peptidoglycan/LPS O-acetylase OafA/YrhL